MRNPLPLLGKLLLLAVLAWCFWPGVEELWQTYTSFWLVENAIAAGVVLAGYLFLAVRYGRTRKTGEVEIDKRSQYISIAVGIVLACGALLANNLLGGFEIVPPILVYLVLYSWSGYWLRESFWRRSFLVFVLLVLTLPILERIQKFVGFPLRLLTAQVVSILLSLTGAGHVTESTVIVTENYATTIDLPCSGVKSVYYGGIVLLAVYFLQGIRFSLRSIGLAVGFILLLLFFNIWRVFGLVYVYGILKLQGAGDIVHVGLGVVGFAVSCIALWQASEQIKTKPAPSVGKKILAPGEKGILAGLTTSHLLTFSIVCVTITAMLTKTIVRSPALSPATEGKAVVNLQLPASQLTQIPFSDKENTLFLQPEVTFAAKYVLDWKNHTDLSLLLVTSRSARAYHDPELCLQGLGYVLLKSEVVPVGDTQLQHLLIQTNAHHSAPQASVFYWYVSRDSVVTDYSERVWQQVKNPGTTWVLVEVAVLKPDELSQSELEAIFTELTGMTRERLL